MAQRITLGNLLHECATKFEDRSSTDPRTGLAIQNEPADWTTHPNNPMRES